MRGLVILYLCVCMRGWDSIEIYSFLLNYIFRNLGQLNGLNMWVPFICHTLSEDACFHPFITAVVSNMSFKEWQCASFLINTIMKISNL